MTDFVIFCTTCKKPQPAEKIQDPEDSGRYVNRCHQCGTRFGAPPPPKK